MTKKAKKVIAKLISILGVILALYIGVYWLFCRPVYFLIHDLTAGTLTVKWLIWRIMEIFMAATVSGAIWCLFDIWAGYFREKDED